MHPAQSRIEADIMAWAERNPDAKTAPPHIESLLEKQKRYDQMNQADGQVFIDPYQLEQIRDDLYADMEGYTARREAEQDLAIYIDQVAGSQLEPSLYDIAQRLNDCRASGAVGVKPDGGPIIAWDSKCGIVRLCPDESREETQRLAEWYLPPMVDFKKEKPTHRLFYAVFTSENVPAGSLREGKKAIIEKFKTWKDESRAEIKGALVIQEDPLSAGHDWNVHLNVILLVDGRFDYDAARNQWGGNVHFQELTGEPSELRKTLLEAIKYSAQIVPDKSDHHSRTGQSEAPAMTQWPHELWLEWWRAGKGFRRVRSYGCLYGLHRKRWEKAQAETRRDWCDLAREQVLASCRERDRDDLLAKWARQHRNEWTDINEPDRAKLRKVMTHGAPLDMHLIQWVGVLNLGDDLSYRVDLIPGDNFLTGRPRRNNLAFDFYRARGPT